MSVSTVVEKLPVSSYGKVSNQFVEKKQSTSENAELIKTQKRGKQLNLGVLEGLVGYQLKRALNNLYQHFQQHLDHANITPGQMALLIMIQNNAGISQTALARANGIERSTLGEIIDRFEKREFVERRKHATDRRAYALHLSPQGESFLQDLMPLMIGHERDLLSAWNEDDRAQLLRLLSKLAHTQD